MGLIISLGITFAIGMPYTPMHAILPFLYLGKWFIFVAHSVDHSCVSFLGKHRDSA